LVKSIESIDGEDVEVDVIAQIDGVYSHSMALREDVPLDAAERIIQAEIADSRIIASARVLGFLYNGLIYQPRRAIQPGKYVYLAPEDVLEKFYSYDEDEGLLVGYLITRSTVPVYVSIRGFRRHLAILAQTGAGKSYTAGVLLEELLKKGGHNSCDGSTRRLRLLITKERW